MSTDKKTPARATTRTTPAPAAVAEQLAASARALGPAVAAGLTAADARHVLAVLQDAMVSLRVAMDALGTEAGEAVIARRWTSADTDPAVQAGDVRAALTTARDRATSTAVALMDARSTLEAFDGAVPRTCGRCQNRFDASDPSFDGAAEYRDSGFCRGCVDRCHESSDFAHACPVCDPARRSD